MLKNTADATEWQIVDDVRSDNPVGNPADEVLIAHDTAAAYTDTNPVDFLGTGFNVLNSSGSMNGTGDRMIYMAWAEFPFGGSGVAQARAR